jgi:hypothetical protein
MPASLFFGLDSIPRACELRDRFVGDVSLVYDAGVSAVTAPQTSTREFRGGNP